MRGSVVGTPTEAASGLQASSWEDGSLNTAVRAHRAGQIHVTIKDVIRAAGRLAAMLAIEGNSGAATLVPRTCTVG